MTSLFCCPLCGAPLEKEGKTYTCSSRHSFDCAKEGYTYLLPVNQKHSASPGDDPGMATARRDFLSKGYYQPLRDALCDLAVSHTGEAPSLLDTGCGEGYYTSGIYQALLAAGKCPRMAGTDISKPIVRLAAKREKAVEFGVASSFHLPVADGSMDLLLNCFSPLAIEEFRRVLRPGGVFLYVVPAADHLWELKQVLYETPYLNEEKETPYDGFTYETILPVKGEILLKTQEEIHALFQMTPYYWKTPRDGAERLAALDSLTTRISFHIHVFKAD